MCCRSKKPLARNAPYGEVPLRRRPLVGKAPVLLVKRPFPMRIEPFLGLWLLTRMVTLSGLRGKPLQNGAPRDSPEDRSREDEGRLLCIMASLSAGTGVPPFLTWAMQNTRTGPKPRFACPLGLVCGLVACCCLTQRPRLASVQAFSFFCFF